MFKNKKLICPGCMKSLETDGSFTYDDICGSSWSMKYVCVNGDMKFNEFEDIYGHKKYAAFNSFSKKVEIEIYKKGLTKKKYLSPALTLWWLRPYIEFNYKGDEMGNILKRSYKLKFLKRNDRNEFTIHYSSSISSFLFTLKYFRKQIKYFKKNKSRFSANDLRDTFELPSWDKRIYRKLALKFKLIFYKKIKKEIDQYNNFYMVLDDNKYQNINKESYKILKDLCPKDLDLLKELLKDHSKDKFVKILIRKRKLSKLI